jgi:hypothetical protein
MNMRQVKSHKYVQKIKSESLQMSLMHTLYRREGRNQSLLSYDSRSNLTYTLSIERLWIKISTIVPFYSSKRYLHTIEYLLIRKLMKNTNIHIWLHIKYLLLSCGEGERKEKIIYRNDIYNRWYHRIYWRGSILNGFSQAWQSCQSARSSSRCISIHADMSFICLLDILPVRRAHSVISNVAVSSL